MKEGLSRDNYIEQTLKTAFGYNEEQLLAEFERAQAQPDDSNLISPTDEFQKIWARIEAERPREEKQEVAHKVLRFKQLRKPLVLVAALCVLMMSMGIIASGNREFNYWNRKVSSNSNNQVWNNYGDVISAATEKEAYEAIGEKLGIQALELEYLPKGMKFIEAKIVLEQARLEFSYKKQRIQLCEALYDVEDSTGTFSNRKTATTVFNKWLDQEILIEKEVLANGKVEYGAKIDLRNARYSISGIIEEEEFIQIVENLKIYE